MGERPKQHNILLDIYNSNLAHECEELKKRRNSDRYSRNAPGWGLCIWCETKLDGRRELANQYSWAVPDDPTLDLIASYSPLVEVGAGTGYWAKLLADRGADIVAYDANPPTGLEEYNNVWHSNSKGFYNVQEADATVSGAHPDRTLLLIWPPYSTSMASDALQAYEGDTLIYIGEGAGGCTADDLFHYLIGAHDLPCWECCEEGLGSEGCWYDCENIVKQHSQQFKLLETVPIPQWDGLHDKLSIHTRL